MDYREFLAKHFDTAADVTIAVHPCRAEEAEEFRSSKNRREWRDRRI